MRLKVFDSIEMRMVRNSVFPRKVKVTMRNGPRNQWKSGDSSIPVASRPNQIDTIHSAISLLFSS